MPNTSKNPATKEDLYLLSCQLEYTKIAIGCILSSLAKRADLNSVFDEAFETAHEVSSASPDDEGSIYVGKIIESIKGYADVARKAYVSPDLPDEHRGSDIHGMPNDPNHPWYKERAKESA